MTHGIYDCDFQTHYALKNKVIPIVNYIESQGGSVYQIDKIQESDGIFIFYILFKYEGEFPYDKLDAWVWTNIRMI